MAREIIKIKAEILDYIRTVLKTCSICGVESVAISSEAIRGVAQDHLKGIYLLDNVNIPDSLPFTGMGIGRVKALVARLSVLDDLNTVMEINIDEKDNGDYIVGKMFLKDKKTKVEFSCCEPSRIKSPKSFKKEIVYTFSMTPDTLKLMSKSIVAIESNKISFESKDGETIKFITSDTAGDKLEHMVATDLSVEDGVDQTFKFMYEIKYILPLMKAAADNDGIINIRMADNGIIKMSVNGFDVLILPEKNED